MCNPYKIPSTGVEIIIIMIIKSTSQWDVFWMQCLGTMQDFRKQLFCSNTKLQTFSHCRRMWLKTGGEVHWSCHSIVHLHKTLQLGRTYLSLTCNKVQDKFVLVMGRQVSQTHSIISVSLKISSVVQQANL